MLLITVPIKIHLINANEEKIGEYFETGGRIRRGEALKADDLYRDKGENFFIANIRIPLPLWDFVNIFPLNHGAMTEGEVRRAISMLTFLKPNGAWDLNEETNRLFLFFQQFVPHYITKFLDDMRERLEEAIINFYIDGEYIILLDHTIADINIASSYRFSLQLWRYNNLEQMIKNINFYEEETLRNLTCHG